MSSSIESSEQFARLREALNDPSEESLYAIAEVIQESVHHPSLTEQGMLLPYVMEHLEDWPDEHRTWKRAELPPHLSPLTTTHRMDESRLAQPLDHQSQGTLQPTLNVPGESYLFAMSPQDTFAWYTDGDHHIVYHHLETNTPTRLSTEHIHGSRFALHPDRQHLLYKDEADLQLIHHETGHIATQTLPPPPPSPYQNMPHEWESWQFVQNGERVLYAGYNEQEEPLIYLLDTFSLAILDTLQPQTSLVWDRPLDNMIPLLGYGEDGIWFHTTQPAERWGLYANVGDSFVFCNIYGCENDKLVMDMDLTLERTLSACSDQTIHGISFMPQGHSLLVCDDLGLFSVVSLQAKERVLKYFSPLKAYTKDEDVELTGYQDTMDRYSLYTDGVASVHGQHIFIDYEVDEYRTDGGLYDFPGRFFVALDTTTLAPRGVIPHDMLRKERMGEILLHPNGWFSSIQRGKRQMYRWSLLATP